jgi:hypothetical protein
VEDTNALALAFNKIAAANGRALATPSKIYITGVSMGGHVTAAAIDEEALAYANHKVSYSGAVPMCGVLGDTELYDFFAAYQAAAMQLAGVPATSWPVTNWATIQPAVKSALFTTFPSTTATGATTAQGDKLKTIVQNLTGGQRPMFDVGFAGPYTDTVWGTFGRDGKMLGILNDDVVSTKNFVYQLDNSPALSAEETAFNNTIYRVQATPDANRLRTDGLRWVPKTNARFNIPVVTIHTLGDMYVPFSMEQIFKKRADAEGTSGMLVQRAIRGVAHCDFTINEQVKAFQDMVTWESGGAKPQGDDVLTASTVADPKYGCKFTDNTLTVDEPATSSIAKSRAQLAAAFSCNLPKLSCARPLLKRRPGAACQSAGAGSLQSLPPVAQLSRLTSWMMMSTLPGAQPRLLQVASVTASTKARFCSTLRPSNSCTLMVGMAVFPHC